MDQTATVGVIEVDRMHQRTIGHGSSRNPDGVTITQDPRLGRPTHGAGDAQAGRRCAAGLPNDRQPDPIKQVPAGRMAGRRGDISGLEPKPPSDELFGRRHAYAGSDA